EFSRRENLNAQMSCVFQRYLALANQVLSWNFLPPNHILCFFKSHLFMDLPKKQVN
ncbi:Exportin-4, partial [Xenoophorus captivus]